MNLLLKLLVTWKDCAIDPSVEFKRDKLLSGSTDTEMEEFDERASILDIPIYKSSKFYLDSLYIYDSIKRRHITSEEKPTPKPVYRIIYCSGKKRK